MKRKIYETPRTTYYSVEVEGSFAGSASVANPDDDRQGRIDAQSINENMATFGDTADFWGNGGSGWSSSN